MNIGDVPPYFMDTCKRRGCQSSQKNGGKPRGHDCGPHRFLQSELKGRGNDFGLVRIMPSLKGRTVSFMDSREAKIARPSAKSRPTANLITKAV